MKKEIKDLLSYLFIYIIAWTVVDFVLTLLRSVTFVLARTIQRGLVAGILSYAVFKIMERKYK